MSLEYLGFIKKGTAKIPYIYKEDGTIEYKDYYYSWHYVKDENKDTSFTLSGYRLVVKGKLTEVGESHIRLDDKLFSIKPKSLANLINDKKSIGKEIYLNTAKNSGGAFWEYLLETDLKKFKLRPTDSLIKDEKMRKVLSKAGWSQAAITRKFNAKGKEIE